MNFSVSVCFRLCSSTCSCRHVISTRDIAASGIGSQLQDSSLAGVLVRLQFMPSKDRATNPLPEKQGGEGWLVSAEQQLPVQTRHGDCSRAVGCSAHL